MSRISQRVGKMKPLIFWTAFLTMLLLAFGMFSAMVSAQSPRVVKVGVYDNPPKISVDADGNVSGFWADLIEYIAEQEGWQIEYVPGTWTDGLDNLQSGAIDILPDVAYTDERAKLYDFSDSAILVSWSRLYVRDGNTDIQNIQDLDGKSVAALAKSVNLDGPDGFRELIRGFDLNTTIIEMDDYLKVFEAVESGDVDAGITNRNFGDEFASNYKVKATSIIFQPITLEFAFPKNAPNTPYFTERIDAQMTALKQDNNSVYYQLLAQYFETSIAEKEVLPHWLNLVLQVGLGIILTFILGFIFARLQIKRQTDEIQAQYEALRESEAWYQAIYNSPSDAIFIHDAETGAILDANDAGVALYGYTHEELPNINIEVLSSGEPPYTQENAIKNVQKAITEGEYRFDWQAKNNTGRIFWVEVILKHLIINKKEYVIAALRDIDSRKKAENDLAAEKERLAVMLNSIGDGVIATDTDGNIVIVNKIAEQLTGWKREDAVGQPLLEVFTIVDARSGELREDPVSKVLSTGQIIGLANHTVLVAKDGTRRSIADSGAPIFDTDSNIIGVILVFRDVTEKEKNEAAIMKMKKLESIGVLAGGIAHDFNNILTAILGNISLARMELSATDKTYPLLESAEKASLRARDLTQQLLTFSKGGDPVKKSTAIDKVIMDSAEFVLHDTSVAGQYNCPDDLWLVEVDAGQISQVIQNIVLNARDAMPGGGTIAIDCANVENIRVERPNLPDGKYVKIIITDTGSGIPDKYLEKIFDPYFSTKQSGSGLGLAITHSIIQKHDGDIVVQSTMGEGTSFSIFLPASGEQKPQYPTSVDTKLEGGNARILVMDDEEIVQDVVQSILSHLGYEVFTANDGDEAIRVYREHLELDTAIDLVIMDLTIPGGMGGKEAVNEVLEINPKAKVVVASGYSNDPILANYRDYGFCAAIVKPFEIGELKTLVDNILTQSI